MVSQDFCERRSLQPFQLFNLDRIETDAFAAEQPLCQIDDTRLKSVFDRTTDFVECLSVFCPEGARQTARRFYGAILRTGACLQQNRLSPTDFSFYPESKSGAKAVQI